MFRINQLKQKLLAGDAVYGCWVAGGTPTECEVLGHVGFNFLLADYEHGAGETLNVIDALRAIETTPTPGMVRVGWNDHVLLKRVLDGGVQSVMIPSVDTPEAAEAAISACRYPPAGIRGYAASIVRASTYGMEDGYIHKANENMLVAIQLESVAAIENAAAIAALDGADIVFIGINDLAGNMGLLGQTEHPEVQAMALRAEQAILKAGKVLGTVPNGGASVNDLLERGYRFIVGPHNIAMLRDAGISAVSDYRSLKLSRERGETPTVSLQGKSY